MAFILVPDRALRAIERFAKAAMYRRSPNKLMAGHEKFASAEARAIYFAARREGGATFKEIAAEFGITGARVASEIYRHERRRHRLTPRPPAS